MRLPVGLLTLSLALTAAAFVWLSWILFNGTRPAEIDGEPSARTGGIRAGAVYFGEEPGGGFLPVIGAMGALALLVAVWLLVVLRLRRLRAELEAASSAPRTGGEAFQGARDAMESPIEQRTAKLEQDNARLREVEAKLRDSEEKFHQLADNITDAFWIRSPDMREVHYISPAFEQIWGRPVEALYANPQQWPDFILPEDRDRVMAAFASLTRDAPSLDIEYRILRPGGEIRWVRARGYNVRNAERNLIRHTGIVTDITDRKRAEAQLLQSQKLETVGMLAGGVAHEFNSILTVIIGQSEFIAGELPPGHPLSENVAGIRDAAERAADLTRQLLAYGRGTFLQPEPLDLNQVLAGMESMLRHVAGSRVQVRIVRAPALRAVKADAGQIRQVILNLAMNAAAAMPGGGSLTLETDHVSFDEKTALQHPELKPGDYVMLSVTDTGIGMSEAVKARIFDPFFTTKDVGQGPGLGLSTCYGIIRQSGGHIRVQSEPGEGATFRIYLPQIETHD